MYQEIRNAQGQLVSIIRQSDYASIPLSEANRDYQDYLAWAADGNTVSPDPAFSVDAFRQIKWLDIKAQRDARKAGGVKVTTAGVSNWFHSDADSRIQWLGLKDRARDVITAGGAMTDSVKILGQNVMWKTMTGAFAQVTVQMAFDVVEATGILDAILFSQAETKRIALSTYSTPESFDTTSGWNQTYEESLN